jgi:hypothetical protein
MTTELRLLVASVILGLVQLIAASHLISFQYGYRWTGGSRDEPVDAVSISITIFGPSHRNG